MANMLAMGLQGIISNPMNYPSYVSHCWPYGIALVMQGGLLYIILNKFCLAFSTVN